MAAGEPLTQADYGAGVRAVQAQGAQAAGNLNALLATLDRQREEILGEIRRQQRGQQIGEGVGAVVGGLALSSSTLRALAPTLASAATEVAGGKPSAGMKGLLQVSADVMGRREQAEEAGRLAARQRLPTDFNAPGAGAARAAGTAEAVRGPLAQVMAARQRPVERFTIPGGQEQPPMWETLEEERRRARAVRDRMPSARIR